jgi:hypothetical protein
MEMQKDSFPFLPVPRILVYFKAVIYAMGGIIMWIAILDN